VTGELLDDFSDVSGWSAVVSGRARLEISRDSAPSGSALRLDFDFRGGGGFVVARRALALELPEAWALDFEIRGPAPPNAFELKLVDPSGYNVWRFREESFLFPAAWRSMRVRSRDVDFAWGPAGGGAIERVGALELALAAGPGGKGTVWIAALRLEDESFRGVPTLRASSALPGFEPERAFEASASRPTGWRSVPSKQPQWLEIDFGREREYGGLIVTWEGPRAARCFELAASADGVAWRTLHTARAARGARSYVYLPGGASRWLRLGLDPEASEESFGIARLEVRPPDFARSIDAFFAAVAAREPRGLYPRYLRGEQCYWTLAGVPEAGGPALLDEDGRLEVDRGAFSLEPFLYADGRLLSAMDASPAQQLAEGYLPVPSVRWSAGELALETTAFATSGPGGPALYVRYRVENEADAAREVRLFAAVRPFQVTPPWQRFESFGGATPIRAMAYEAGAVVVDGQRVVLPLTAPDGFGAAAFESGGITEALQAGELPHASRVHDAFGYASGALRFDLVLAPRSAQEVFLAVPFHGAELAREGPGPAHGPEQLGAALRGWRTKLGGAAITLPPAAAGAAETWKSAVAHILLCRDGAALQPGPRRYARSWIRDGAVMCAALLRSGCHDEVRDFLRWYVRFQREDGFVPCCVDGRGPDPLPEHDSHGQLVYAMLEHFRLSGDRALLAELWPAARRAVACIEALRAQRLAPELRTGEKRASYGLLPESVSHEGYLAQPVHSYWDDFWALRGIKDAAAMAAILGDEGEARRLAALRDDFRATLLASLAQTMQERGIDYLPGSVEWADPDPTATAAALAPIGELAQLPAAAVARSFERYLERFRQLRRGEAEWANYTPYEIRIVGALVRLGWRDAAHELLSFFLADRRPLAWNQWPEIAWRDPRSPAHLGDLPHAWIAAEYVLAFQSLLVFEREEDDALVLAAGLPLAWLPPGSEVRVEDLPTCAGRLCYTLRREGAGTLRLAVGGELALPRGGIVLRPPLPGPIFRARVDGAGAAWREPGEIVLRRVPCDVVIECG
jgi:hypothetical protein